MGTERITEYGNLKLARFMGGEITRTETFVMPHGSQHEVTINTWNPPQGLNHLQQVEARMGTFKYDSDWNWLFSVIDRIESLGFDFSISRIGIQVWRFPGNQVTDLIIVEDFLDDYTGAAKQLMCMHVCVSFVEWYEKQNKTKDDERL